jgi:hypothetical protein
VERDWIVVCLVTETGPDALGVSGSMGRLSARSCSGSGNATSPKRDDFAPTASGPDLTAEGCGELTQGDGR